MPWNSCSVGQIVVRYGVVIHKVEQPCGTSLVMDWWMTFLVGLLAYWLSSRSINQSIGLFVCGKEHSHCLIHRIQWRRRERFVPNAPMFWFGNKNKKQDSQVPKHVTLYRYDSKRRTDLKTKRIQTPKPQQTHTLWCWNWKRRYCTTCTRVFDGKGIRIITFKRENIDQTKQ